MHRHENRQAADGDDRRIMRKGMIGEWRTWLDGGLSQLFGDPKLHDLARQFGYSEWPEAE